MNTYMINATENHAYLDLTEDYDPRDKHEGKFIYRNQKEEISIKPGDHFASLTNSISLNSLDKKAQLFNKGIIENVYTIEDKSLTKREREINLARIKDGKKPIKYFRHTLDFTDAESFKTHKSLDDYSYSLLKIYKRYINPVRHFSRVVTELPKSDYETLELERIYIERTLFGRLINSIPYENRLQFILIAVNQFKKADFREIPLADALILLKDFVSSGLIKMGEYLIESQKLIKNNYELFGDIEKVGFISPDIFNSNEELKEDHLDLKTDYIESQSKLFNRLFEIDTDFDSLFSIAGFEIKQNEKMEFRKIFSESSWPIDLTFDNYE
ncbi:MAG: hypothetical protein C0448_12225 [Sphingobacteriaceae bacterium]|nr:hypothetical protein [Sphingobacteriaceae bacterium]